MNAKFEPMCKITVVETLIMQWNSSENAPRVYNSTIYIQSPSPNSSVLPNNKNDWPIIFGNNATREIIYAIIMQLEK